MSGVATRLRALEKQVGAAAVESCSACGLPAPRSLTAEDFRGPLEFHMQFAPGHCSACDGPCTLMRCDACGRTAYWELTPRVGRLFPDCEPKR